MPDAWSDKNERQYKRIKRSQMKRGKPEEKAEEIAARTVNKQRRKESRTPARSARGSGNSKSGRGVRSSRGRLEERTKRELYDRAQRLHIAGRSQMSKDELIEAIRGQRS